jgi:hypothetical protein
VYQTDSFSGFPRAFLEHVLNKLVAFRSVFDRNSNDCTGHLSLALGTVYILFSLWLYDASMPPCQFFCFVSCESFTYSSPFSSVLMTKESIVWCPFQMNHNRLNSPSLRTGPVQRVHPVVPCTGDVAFQSSNVLSSGFISNSSFNNCVFNFDNWLSLTYKWHYLLMLRFRNTMDVFSLIGNYNFTTRHNFTGLWFFSTTKS